MEKNLPSQTIPPLPPLIRVLSSLRAHLRSSTTLFKKRGVTALTFKPLAFSTKLHWTKTTSTTSSLGAFSPFFVWPINFFVLPDNFTVSGVCNSDLYQTFIFNTNLLLILLI